ncbi:hypothetical protein [Lysobacter gummosus]|uniref:hypothetical protein n=1 Tax=Lysobacter gummosus TaxID=262324 RepID=UPI0036286965
MKIKKPGPSGPGECRRGGGNAGLGSYTVITGVAGQTRMKPHAALRCGSGMEACAAASASARC